MARRQRAAGAVIEGQPDWLERRANDIGGLDHLGVAAVSEHLYGGLVPGLTNVTERARYFAFYPWVLHRFAQEPPAEHSGRAWRQWIRRLDCAYGLASIAHAREERAVVGAKTARRVLGAAGGGTIDFHAFADLNEKGGVPRSGSYFLNPEGGFGQYYKGPLVELGVLCKTEQHRDPAHQLTTYCGLALAQALDGNPGFAELRDLASSGSATVDDLTSLGARIGPSAIEVGGPEERALRRLFLGDDDQLCRGQTRESREWRRGSLLLGLKFVRDVGPIASSTFAEEMRWACASEVLPNGRRWSIPSSLAAVVESWRAYHRHDLLSFALGVVLEACVQLLDERPMSPRELAATVAQHACAGNPNAGGRFLDLVASSSNDEASTRQLLELTFNADEPRPRVAGAVRLLARLANEHAACGDHPFGSVPVAASATAFEVQLGAWIQRVGQRGNEPARQFIEALVLEWVIHRHLRVATLKLAYDWKSTFKFRPDEGVLRTLVDEPPAPILTNPRLRQARQVLEDLHLLQSTNGSLSLSADGQRALEGVS